MIPLPKRLEQFPEYIFSSLTRDAKKLEKETGKKILDLSVGSPTYPPSKDYTEVLKNAIDDPKSYLYPGYGATQAFAEALIQWYKTRFNVALEQNELFPLLGGKDGVSHMPLALADVGGEILVPDPGYPAFVGPALLMGSVVVPYLLPEESNFKLNITEIEKKISKKTQLLWVNFPSNPTGQVISLAELEPIVWLCKKKNIWLVYDNAYAEITYDGYVSPSVLQVPGAKEVAVELGSFSKMYSFAGLRMGWAVGNQRVIAALAKVKSQFDSGLSFSLQQLGAYALTHPDKKWHEAMIHEYQRKKKILMDIFTSWGLTINDSQGALYLWAKIPETYENSVEYAADLLQTKHILVTPGSAFGKNGVRHVRISFSSDITNLAQYL